MSAAYTLKKAGVWADVYEAGGAPGGRLPVPHRFDRRFDGLGPASS